MPRRQWRRPRSANRADWPASAPTISLHAPHPSISEDSWRSGVEKRKGPPLPGRPFLSKPGSKYHLETNGLAEQLLFELLRHLLDILRRPARDIHPQPEP